MYRPLTHLSPIPSGDSSEYCSSSSSSSSTPNCVPPPPSAAVSSSHSLEDLNIEPTTTSEMPTWRKNKANRAGEQVPAKIRKISALNEQYASVRKRSKRVVTFRGDDNDSNTTLDDNDSNCNEIESSYWSDGGASYGYSKYIHSSPHRPSIQMGTSSKIHHLNFPRTNPHATLARQFPSLSRGNSLWPVMSESSTCTTTTTTSATTSSGSDSDSVWMDYTRNGRNTGSIIQSSMANAARRRILAGLKAFGIKGELLVSILLNRGLMTVTVEEGRNLVPPCGSGCASTYVRLSLMPDEEKRTQCKTDLIPHSNRPIFHQTFTVELLPEDYGKRLVISMWHRERMNEKSVLLGCMAFTVRHMVQTNKAIDGWYFLLSPQYGRRKHLAVHKVNMVTYYGSVDSDLENHI